MAIEIEGGADSNKAHVNNQNQLDVFAVTHTGDQHINFHSGKVWSIPFEGLNPTAADDYVLYIKNTGDVPIHISDIRVMADTAATQLEVHAVSGTASGGTTVSPISRTIGSSATLSAITETGADITGITTDGTIFYIQCAVVNTEYHLRTTSKIRIPKGKAVALLVETGTANITGVVSIVEEDEI